VVLAVAAVALLGSCSEPAAGTDSLAAGKARVRDLLAGAAGALDLAGVGADLPPVPPAGEVTCRRTFLGYAVGTTGEHRAEVPLIVALPGGTEAEPLLDTVEAHWRDEGYSVDRTERSDGRFPKVRARVDGYELVATALRDRPQFHLYAVSPCLRDA
jgi:hypothetical protein